MDRARYSVFARMLYFRDFFMLAQQLSLDANQSLTVSSCSTLNSAYLVEEAQNLASGVFLSALFVGEDAWIIRGYRRLW